MTSRVGASPTAQRALGFTVAFTLNACSAPAPRTATASRVAVAVDTARRLPSTLDPSQPAP